ncbi:MAG: hypothetical protein BWK76_12280 [Desulfobulbaceae bacterium A2]|nr:MAG: hypothetical protein BWK76_12280 [Desulfobulbaceae bacterium A2]
MIRPARRRGAVRHPAIFSALALGIFAVLVIALFYTATIKLNVLAQAGCFLAGLGLLGGIGCTMSIFVGELAFPLGLALAEAKLAIFHVSLIAGAGGYMWLRLTLPSSAAAGRSA